MFLSTHHHKKIREIGTGLFLYESANFVFDFIFYPLIIAYEGIVSGGAIAVIASLIMNSIVFLLYEYLKIDWLGAHALRELDNEENKSSIAKLMTWMGSHKKTLWEKIASPIVFVALTLPIDPLIVAVHHRHVHFKGITIRDWMLLWGATLAANAWWLLKVGVIIEGAKWLWYLFF